MKTLKFWFALICSLVSLSACSSAKLDSEGQEFVSNLLEQQKQHWDPSKLAPVLDPASGAKPGDLDTVFKLYTNVVGPIKSVQSIERTNFRSAVGIGVPDYDGQYVGILKCAKGDAKVAVRVFHKDGKWTVVSFNVNSDAFKNVNKAEREQGQKYVDELAKQICNGWNADILNDNADPKLAEDLVKNPMLMKGIFLASQKALGGLKSYTPARFVNIQPFDGKTMYNFEADEEFEKGKARFQFMAVKNGNEWKLRGFHVDAKRKL